MSKLCVRRLIYRNGAPDIGSKLPTPPPGKTAMPDTATQLTSSSAPTVEHFDVLIVGAGISGVGGAYHLTKQCPGTSFGVLEGQDSVGWTWITHRYPCIHSDSDLYTFGYRF